jgi:hypothetical protein
MCALSNGPILRFRMRGRKLVVQLIETFSEKTVPVFVEKLDAIDLAEKFKLELARHDLRRRRHSHS